MIGASGLGDFLGGVWDGVRTDISNAANQAQTNVRNDLANAVNQLGSAVSSSAAGAIAPNGQKPVAIPLSANQLTVVTLVGVGMVLLILYLAFRRK